MTDDPTQSPALQAADPAASPVNGQVPPPEHRWKPGQSGNPKGRPSAGLSIREFWNQLQEASRDDLTAIVDDPSTPANKLAAARAWLRAASDERTNTGLPVGGADLDRIIEHTAGKAVQVMDVNANVDANVRGKFDLSGLSDEDLLKFEQAFAGRAGGTGEPGGEEP